MAKSVYSTPKTKKTHFPSYGKKTRKGTVIVSGESGAILVRTSSTGMTSASYAREGQVIGKAYEKSAGEKLLDKMVVATSKPQTYVLVDFDDVVAGLNKGQLRVLKARAEAALGTESTPNWEDAHQENPEQIQVFLQQHPRLSAVVVQAIHGLKREFGDVGFRVRLVDGDYLILAVQTYDDVVEARAKRRRFEEGFWENHSEEEFLLSITIDFLESELKEGVAEA